MLDLIDDNFEDRGCYLDLLQDSLRRNIVDLECLVERSTEGPLETRSVAELHSGDSTGMVPKLMETSVCSNSLASNAIVLLDVTQRKELGKAPNLDF